MYYHNRFDFSFLKQGSEKAIVFFIKKFNLSPILKIQEPRSFSFWLFAPYFFTFCENNPSFSVFLIRIIIPTTEQFTRKKNKLLNSVNSLMEKTDFKYKNLFVSTRIFKEGFGLRKIYALKSMKKGVQHCQPDGPQEPPDTPISS